MRNAQDKFRFVYSGSVTQEVSGRPAGPRFKENMHECSDEPHLMKLSPPVSSIQSRCAADRQPMKFRLALKEFA